MAPRPTFPRATTERRRLPHVRTGFATRMTVAAEGEDLALVDLSHAGCAVESRRHLNPGDDLYLTFTLDTCLSFIVPVRVTFARLAPHSRGAGVRHMIGVEYDTARQPDVHRIIEILLEAIDEPFPVH